MEDIREGFKIAGGQGESFEGSGRSLDPAETYLML